MLKLPVTPMELNKIIEAVNYMEQQTANPDLLKFQKYLEEEKKILTEKPSWRL